MSDSELSDSGQSSSSLKEKTRALLQAKLNTKRVTESDGGFHQIFTWIPTEWGNENVHLKDKDVVVNHGVPRPVLVKSIKNQMKREGAFLQLPFVLLFVMTFATWVMSKDRTNDSRDLEDAVNEDLDNNAVFAYGSSNDMVGHKNLYDVHSKSDVFSWLRIGLVPLLFRTNQSWSETTDGAHLWIDTPMTEVQRRSYLQYNRLVGGLRLSQSRAAPGTCVGANQHVAATYDMLCSPNDLSAGIDLSIQPNQYDILKLSANQGFDPELSRWFLLDENEKVIEHRLKQLEYAAWIDNSTVHVAAHFFTYNAYFHSLTLTGAHFVFARTGRIWKKVVQQCTFLNPYDLTSEHWWIVACDIVFGLLLFKMLVMECWHLYRNFKTRRPGELWFKYLNWGDAVAWLTIVSGFSLVAVWTSLVHKMQGLEQNLLAVSSEESGMSDLGEIGETRLMVGVLTFNNHLDELADHFEQVFQYQQLFQSGVCLFPILLMARLFKAFSSQPRLALVTETLNRSLMDVFHFLVVFITIFSIFVVMAVSLFGREMHQFSTFERAFNSCFVVLMGEFNHEELFAVAKHMGPLWFWMFQIVLMLVMLNMLLAIIMDVYSEVKRGATNAVSLPEQMLILILRIVWISQGNGLPLKTIVEKLEKGRSGPSLEQSVDSTQSQQFGFGFRSSDLNSFRPDLPKNKARGCHWDQSEILTANAFADLIDGMEMAQAKRLMKCAVREWRESHSKSFSITDVMNTISVFHQQLLDQSRLIFENQQDLANQTSSVHALWRQQLLQNEEQEQLPKRTTCESDSSSEAQEYPPALPVHRSESACTRREGDRMERLELALERTNERLGRMEELSLTTNERLDTMQALLMRLVLPDERLQPEAATCGLPTIEKAFSTLSTRQLTLQHPERPEDPLLRSLPAATPTMTNYFQTTCTPKGGDSADIHGDAGPSQVVLAIGKNPPPNGCTPAITIVKNGSKQNKQNGRVSF